jgi:hypothetical protein
LHEIFWRTVEALRFSHCTETSFHLDAEAEFEADDDVAETAPVAVALTDAVVADSDDAAIAAVAATIQKRKQRSKR